MKIFKPVPFFEGNATEIGKMSLWAIVGFALIYFIASTIFNILASYFLEEARASTTVIPSVIAGTYIACAWFCKRFYKKYSRVMSKMEYRYFFKRLLIASTTMQIIFTLAYLGLFMYTYRACQIMPDPSCQWVNSVYEQVPPIGFMIIIILFTIGLILFTNALFIRMDLKMWIRSIAARQKHQAQEA